MKLKNIAFTLFIFLLYPLNANAAIVNFDSFADTTNIHGMNLGGVTFTATDGQVNIHTNGRGGVGYSSAENAIAASNWTSGLSITATFDNAVNYVSVIGGDSCCDVDRFTMEAFDINGTSLGLMDTGIFSGADPFNAITGSYGDYRKLSISANNIYSVELTQVNWGISWDDLEYETQVVPIPAAVWLFASGALGLVSVARRRR